MTHGIRQVNLILIKFIDFSIQDRQKINTAAIGVNIKAYSSIFPMLK
jgi:hypothetical protein